MSSGIRIEGRAARAQQIMRGEKDKPQTRKNPKGSSTLSVTCAAAVVVSFGWLRTGSPQDWCPSVLARLVLAGLAGRARHHDAALRPRDAAVVAADDLSLATTTAAAGRLLRGPWQSLPRLRLLRRLLLLAD